MSTGSDYTRKNSARNGKLRIGMRSWELARITCEGEESRLPKILSKQHPGMPFIRKMHYLWASKFIREATVSIPKITLSRENLYEKVWTSPIHKLSTEFGLSDVGLGKVCRRHQIPVPGRGYWARLQSGQRLKRPPLPAITNARLNNIEIFPSEPRPPILDPQQAEIQIPTILVAEDRALTHRHALRIERFILSTKTDEMGVLLPRKGRVVPVRVSPEALPRALRIIDALLSAVEAANYTLKWESPYNTPLSIAVLDEELTFSISEILDRMEHKPTREEITREKLKLFWHPPKWDYRPSGHLKITIDCTDFRGVRHTWSDGKKKPLEEYLGHFMVGLVLVAKAIKQGREERAEQERKWAEERKQAAEESARQAEYKRKAEVAGKLAASWNQSKLLREFGNTLLAEAEKMAASEDQKQDLEAIVIWTMRHADLVDPLTDLPWVIRQFKNSPWYPGF